MFILLFVFMPIIYSSRQCCGSGYGSGSSISSESGSRYGSGSSISSESGSGYGSRVLMTTNWKKTVKFLIYIFFDKNCNYLWASIKDVQATGDAFSPQKRTSNTSNPDPGTLLNPDSQQCVLDPTLFWFGSQSLDSTDIVVCKVLSLSCE